MDTFSDGVFAVFVRLALGCVVFWFGFLFGDSSGRTVDRCGVIVVSGDIVACDEAGAYIRRAAGGVIVTATPSPAR
jgi:hypothetical protein